MSKGGGSKKGGRTRSVVSFDNSLVSRTHIVDLFTTGLRQNIAESGMAANRKPGAIDREIISDAPDGRRLTSG